MTVGTHISPLLVGRDDLLALGERRIAEVAAGRGHVLLLAGEAGIGKTRLLTTLLRKAGERGFRLAKGDLSPHDTLAVLAAWSDMARSMPKGDFGSLGAQLLAVDRGQGPDSLGSRRSLVRDIVDLVRGAIDRPTVLAFEDLQWSDAVTLEVIAELARATEDLPLLVLGVHRLDELPSVSPQREWRSRMLTQRLAEEIRLTRLTREETGLITTLVLGTGLPAPREVVDAVYRRTNGIPLHIEELLAAIGGQATDGRSILGAQVPDTIEDAILAHAARLSPEARSVARAGSVLGRCFAPDVVAGVLDQPVAALDEPLDELVRAGILFPFEFVDEGYFDFRHQLLRDALYDDVPAADLRRFHARAAEFGARLVGATEIHASIHLERAGLREQAYRSAMAAAREASSVYSHREAFDLYRRAIQNMPAELPDSERAGVWLEYVGAAAALDRSDIARDAANRARELALDTGDAVRAAEALVPIAAYARWDAEPLADRRDLARRVTLESDALPDGETARQLRIFGRALLAHVELDALDYRAARNLFEEQRDLARRWGMARDEADATISLVKLDLVEFGASAHPQTLGELAEEARATGDESNAVNWYRDATYHAVRALDYRTAALHLDEGLQYAQEIEQSFCGHILASMQAIVAWADGRWDGAVKQGGQALAELSSARSRAYAAWAVGWTAAGRGDRAEAEAYLRPALDLARRADWLELLLPAAWGLAEAALVAGDHTAAIAQCEESLAEARQRGECGLLAPFVVTGVRAYQAAGRPDAAARWLGQITRAIGPLAQVAAPAIEHGTGLVKLGEGSITAARDHLERAAAAWDERGRRWEALWARLDLAAADLRANRFAEAMALVREVEGAAEALGSRPLLDRAEQLQRLARGRGAELEAWHPLTVREFEVAGKVAEGLTNAQIAEALFVSPKTVSAHIEHILAKLGATRRAEIAAWVSAIATASAGHAVRA